MKHKNDGYGFCANCQLALIPGWESAECVPIPNVTGMVSSERFRLAAIQDLALMDVPIQAAATKWLLQLLATTANRLKEVSSQAEADRARLKSAEDDVRRLKQERDTLRASVDNLQRLRDEDIRRMQSTKAVHGTF